MPRYVAAIADPEPGARSRARADRARRHGARGRERPPGRACYRERADRTPSRACPSASKPARSIDAGPTRDPRATGRSTGGSDAPIRARDRARSAGPAARSSRSSRPVSRHAAGRVGLGQRARDRATGRRAAALLGRGVVDERAVVQHGPHEPLAQAPRASPGPAARPRSTWTLHREPERGRAVDARRSRAATSAASAMPAAEPARGGRDDSRCSPDRDDRLGGARVELVAEVERAGARRRPRRARACRSASSCALRGPAHRPDRLAGRGVRDERVEPPRSRVGAAWRSSPSASTAAGTTAVVAPSRPRRRRRPGTARAPRR